MCLYSHHSLLFTAVVVLPGVVDFHLKITYEKLHDSNLGVSRMVLRIIEARLKALCVTKKFKKIRDTLNDRLKELNK